MHTLLWSINVLQVLSSVREFHAGCNIVSCIYHIKTHDTVINDNLHVIDTHRR